MNYGGRCEDPRKKKRFIDRLNVQQQRFLNNRLIDSNKNKNKQDRPPIKKIDFAYGLTNARSLWSKIGSLADYFYEHELAVAVVAETWFYKSRELEELQTKAGADHGLHFIDRMRTKRGSANPGGGISIVFNKKKIKLSEFRFKRGSHEIVCAKGKIHGNTRPIFVIGLYLPPKQKADLYHDCLECVANLLLRIKTVFTNPYILVAGDINKRDIDEAIGDFPEIATIITGATRGGAVLDVSACSFHKELVSVHNYGPLESTCGSYSDHRFVTFNFKLRHIHEFKWIRYKSRKITAGRGRLRRENRQNYLDGDTPNAVRHTHDHPRHALIPH